MIERGCMVWRNREDMRVRHAMKSAILKISWHGWGPINSRTTCCNLFLVFDSKSCHLIILIQGDPFSGIDTLWCSYMGRLWNGMRFYLQTRMRRVSIVGAVGESHWYLCLQCSRLTLNKTFFLPYKNIWIILYLI